MAWVQRSASGAIGGVYANRQDGYAEDELPDDNAAVVAYLNPPKPQEVLPQDLMAQFSSDDATKIQAAISGNVGMWSMWYQMIAQKDPMIVGNPRFMAGWNELVQVLGRPRMDAIAAALNVTVG